MDELEGISHRTAMVNAINMHMAEKGHGPPVLLIHGFPELRGAVKMVLVTWPAHSSDSSVHHVVFVGGLIALIDALEQDQCVVCRNWELTAPWTGKQVKLPVKFIVGDLNLTCKIPWAPRNTCNGRFKKDVPSLEAVVVMEGVGHFITEERPDEITAYIYEFIQKH